MIFSVGLTESTSCLHSIKQFSVSACLSCFWLMCKIGLFLLPYIPEAGDLSGFRFSLPPEAHKVFHVLVGWSQTEYYTWRHTLQVAIDWSAPFCLFSVYCLYFFVFVSMCVVECKACCLWWIATAVETNLDVEERCFCSEIRAASPLCVMMKN